MSWKLLKQDDGFGYRHIVNLQIILDCPLFSLMFHLSQQFPLVKSIFDLCDLQQLTKADSKAITAF